MFLDGLEASQGARIHAHLADNRALMDLVHKALSSESSF